MGYSVMHPKKKVPYFLHKTPSKFGAAFLYFFSKKSEDSIDLPEHLEVVYSKNAQQPCVRKKKK